MLGVTVIVLEIDMSKRKKEVGGVKLLSEN